MDFEEFVKAVFAAIVVIAVLFGMAITLINSDFGPAQNMGGAILLGLILGGILIAGAFYKEVFR